MLENHFNLISQANFYLTKAKESRENINNDENLRDYELRECCLKLQYAIEMYLKGLVENLCGCDYRHTHELRDNIELIDNNRESIEHYAELDQILSHKEEKADRIKSFHTQAVYINGFTTNMRELNAVMNIADELKKFCDKYVIPIRDDSY